MSAYAYRRVVDALEARGSNGRDHGARAQYQCPAHEDRNPSLSITDRDDRALICCHAGCDTLAVLEALDLEWCDLFDERASTKGWTIPTMRRIGAVPSRDGRVELGGVRYMPGAGAGERKTLAAGGATRDLWPDPASIEGPGLFVVEGEPDAVTAAELGLPAVALPGAKAWRPEWAQRIGHGRRWIVVIADADAPGRAAATRCAAAVAAVCPNVRVLDLAPQRTDGFDLSDLAALASTGHDRAQVRALVIEAAKKTPRLGVPPCQPPIGGGTLAPPHENGSTKPSSGVPTGGTPGTPVGTLRVLDIERMLTTPPPPVPWLAQPLLARGCVTMLAGREGQGKSMLALALAAAIGHGATVAGIDFEHGRALYVDAENGEHEAHRRVHGLGVKPGTLVYAEADGFNLKLHRDQLEALVEEHRPDLLVLDSLRSLAPGLDENDSMPVEAVLRPIVKFTQARKIATLILHHAGKVGVEYRGSTAIGAAVELGFTLSRHDDDPERGSRRRLGCWKSRPAAEPPPRWLTIEARDDRILLADAEPFEPGAEKRDELEEELLATLNGQPTSWGAWARSAGQSPQNGTARRARDHLEQRGAVIHGEGGWTRARGEA
jgi:hypothetical protein